MYKQGVEPAIVVMNVLCVRAQVLAQSIKIILMLGSWFRISIFSFFIHLSKHWIVWSSNKANAPATYWGEFGG